MWLKYLGLRSAVVGLLMHALSLLTYKTITMSRILFLRRKRSAQINCDNIVIKK